MPDSSQLDLGAPPGGSKGIPQWIMVVGAVAGIVGVVLLLKNSGGGGGTTAAGTSINAALGSIQEENMNLLGTTQAGIMQTNQNMSAGFNTMSQEMGTGFGTINQGLTTGFLNTQNSFGSLGTQVSSGFNQTNGLLGTLEQDLTNQISAFSSQTQGQFAQLDSMTAQGLDTQAQQGALISSIQQDVQSGLVGQQQANEALSLLETRQQYIIGMQSTYFPAITGSLNTYLPNIYSKTVMGQ